MCGLKITGIINGMTFVIQFYYYYHIIPVVLVHVFNVKSILCIGNYMIISTIHKRMPINGILFIRVRVY